MKYCVVLAIVRVGVRARGEGATAREQPPRAAPRTHPCNPPTHPPGTHPRLRIRQCPGTARCSPCAPCATPGSTARATPTAAQGVARVAGEGRGLLQRRATTGREQQEQRKWLHTQPNRQAGSTCIEEILVERGSGGKGPVTLRAHCMGGAMTGGAQPRPERSPALLPPRVAPPTLLPASPPAPSTHIHTHALCSTHHPQAWAGRRRLTS